MRKTVCCIFAVVLLLFPSCRSKEAVGNPAAVRGEDKPDYTEYGPEDAYCSEELSREAYSQTLKAIGIYPTADSVYTASADDSGWVRFETNENGNVTTGSLCRDPLCTHRTENCPAYMARNSSRLLEANGSLYFFTPVSGGNAYGLIEYNPAAAEIKTIDRLHADGRFIGRVGRFLFYLSCPVIGQKDNGQVVTETQLYRYDILLNKAEYLGKSPNESNFLFSEGAGGFIWYFSPSKRILYRRDVNMKNEEKVVTTDVPMLTYEIHGDEVYYLVRDADGQYGWGYGTLYRYDMISEKTETLYHDVTWFTLDGELLYYTFYDPIPNFDRDVVLSDENGKKTETETVWSMNGNVVYRIPLDQAGKRGESIPGIEKTPKNGQFIGEWYRVYRGFLLVQVKEAYREAERNGMLTGYAAVNMESGEVAYMWTDILIGS